MSERVDLSEWIHPQLDFADVIASNFATFSRLARDAKRSHAAGKLVRAAAYCEIAGAFAMAHHPGLFASGELEDLLVQIGRTLPTGAAKATRPDRAAHVLHVCNHLLIGGPTSYLARFIRNDPGRRHSVALTHQAWRTIAKPVAQAVAESGGRIHLLSEQPGTMLDRAAQLRKLANAADVVFNHISHSNVIPTIAFAACATPVICVNHGDHHFWYGVRVGAIQLALRQAGADLAIRRRGVDPERAMTLPIVLDDFRPTIDRAEAKARLGISPERIVLLSVARGSKYRSVNGVSYADAHAPILERHPNAMLIVVGPGAQSDWERAIARTGGRIVVHAARTDVQQFFAAADIYTDSFPFVSMTSLLEAGVCGAPGVTLFPHSEESGVFGSLTPGLADSLCRPSTYEAYAEHIGALIDNAVRRRALGDKTRAGVLAEHTGAGWRRRLEAVYERALGRDVGLAASDAPAQPGPKLEEVDRLFPFIIGQGPGLGSVKMNRIRMLPLGDRLDALKEYVAEHGVSSALLAQGLRSVTPDWLAVRLRGEPKLTSSTNAASAS